MNQPNFDPYLKWLGIRTSQRPPDHYALLGLRAFEDDPDVIANAADRQMAHVKTFQSGKFAELSQRLLNELAAAQVCLLSAAQKQAYDHHLRRQQTERAAQWAETAELEAADLRDASLPQRSILPTTEEPTIVVSDRPVVRRRRRRDLAPVVLLVVAAVVVGGLGWFVYANKWLQSNLAAPGPSPAPPAPGPPHQAPGSIAPHGARLADDVPDALAGSDEKPPRSGPASPSADANGVADDATTSDDTPLTTILDAVARTEKPDRKRPGQIVGPAQAMDEAERALLRRDVTSAAALLKISESASQRDPALAARWRRLNDVQRALEPFVQAVQQTIAELKGEAELEQAGKRWRILEMRAGRLVVAGPVEQQVINLADVPAGALLDLVRQGSRAADPAARRGGVVLLLYDPQGDVVRARQEMEQLSLLTPVGDDALLRDLVEAAQNRPGQAFRSTTPVTEITLARSPWPTDDALQAAQEKVRQTYADALTATDEDRRAHLVATLLDAARDPSLLAVERAGLLQEAFSQAVLSASADAVAAAVAAIDTHFRIDRFERELMALADALPQARSAAAHEALIRRALELGRRAAVATQLESAQRLTALATAAAKKNRFSDLQAQAKTQAAEIRRWQARRRELNDAWDADAVGQASAAQSLELGQFLCFDQHEWRLGLPKLAHGSDEKLAALAVRDVQAPADAGDRLRLADDWWQTGEHANPRTRAAVRARAAHWYQRVVGHLTGLDRTRIQQRLAQSAAEEQSGGGLSPLVRAAPPERLLVLPGGVAMRFKLIAAGSFLMGPPGRAHEVTLTRPLYLATTEVTAAQWNFLRPQNPRPPGVAADAPAAGLTWDDCQEFVEALKLLPAETPLIARLPTEAEWEYACRAGAATHYSCGDNPQALTEYAWFRNGAAANRVAQKRPNDWGLYDMHGNVWEWCQDRWGDYPNQPQTDPLGITWGDRRVLRGGGFRSPAEQCRSHERRADLPSSGLDDYGFRVVLEL